MEDIEYNRKMMKVIYFIAVREVAEENLKGLAGELSGKEGEDIEYKKILKENGIVI